MEFGQSVESGRTARGLLDESKRKAESPTDAADLTNPEHLRRAADSLAEQLAWAEQAERRKQSAAEDHARQRLGEASERERSIERRLGELAKRGEHGEASLPEEALEQLDKARSAMREAGSELGAGKGERGLERQREAQRLLEQSDSGSTSAGDEGRSGSDGEGGEKSRRLGTRAKVPGADDRRRAEDFRRRVLEGLGRERGGRLSPAIQRYAEGLLQ
jgi:hypothetical protein